MSWRVELGDCVEVMAAMAPDSIEAVVADPPYGLEFMGKEWDKLGAGIGSTANDRDPFAIQRGGSLPFGGGGKRVAYGSSAKSMQAWHEAWARAALRVLKPGGHMLAFGGTRTFHRLACAIEDAGFEIRDCIMWVYGSGFPKSLDVSKAIDKAAGAERVVVGQRFVSRNIGEVRPCHEQEGHAVAIAVTAPATAQAAKWQGWGTALKPAWEPIIVARKPLIGTVAENVLEHGTGALNVDGCRVEAERETGWGGGGSHLHDGGLSRDGGEPRPVSGRWPANVIHDGSEEVERLFPDAGGGFGTRGPDSEEGHIYGMRRGSSGQTVGYGDSGSAARFFYCAKSDRADREDGCRDLPRRFSATMGDGIGAREHSPDEPRAYTKNHHPTVKPTELMRWLCRLVTPKGGTVLDPFTGSGSTGRGALLEGFSFLGIERDPEYVAIAEARIAASSKVPFQEQLDLF